jgi:hypothetical protein
MRKIHLVLIAFFLYHAVSAQDHFLSKIPLEQQVSVSDAIIEGKVVSTTSYWDKGRKNIYSVSIVDVSKVYKGGTRQQIHLVTLGGTVGLEKQISHPSLDLSVHDFGVFITESFDLILEGYPRSTPLYRTIGVSQGFYRHDPHHGNITNPFVQFPNQKELDISLRQLTKENTIKIKPIKSLKKKRNTQQRKSGQLVVNIDGINPTQIIVGNVLQILVNTGQNIY